MDRTQLCTEEDLARNLPADLEYIDGIAHKTFNVTLMAEAATRSWYGWPVAIRRAISAEERVAKLEDFLCRLTTDTPRVLIKRAVAFEVFQAEARKLLEESAPL